MPKIIRKPPTAGSGTERLKIALDGRHNLDGMGCMVLQVIAFLHELGFDMTGGGHLYIDLLDRDHHPLTFFPDGSKIAEHLIVVRSPYQCAADEYDRKFQHPSPF
jgi:hypothetical protein